MTQHINPKAITNELQCFQIGFLTARDGKPMDGRRYDNPKLQDAFEDGYRAYNKKMKLIKK